MAYVDFSLPPGWTELSCTTRDVTTAAAWRTWAEAIANDGPGGFGWMEGLVSPEVQAANQALLERALEALEPIDNDDADTSAYPLSEVAAYVRTLRRLPVEVRVFGAPGALLFLCAARGPLTPVDHKRWVARLVKWTGVRITGDTDGDTGDGYEGWCGDSYGTMDWGLGEVVLRSWTVQPVFAFGAAASYERLNPALDAISVRPSADHPIAPAGISLPAGAAVDDPAGPALRAMQAALAGLRQSIAVTVMFGTAECVFWPEDDRVTVNVDGRDDDDDDRPPVTRDELARVWRESGRDYGAPDPRGVEINGDLERTVELALRTAVVRALIETCHLDGPPAGTVVAPTSWGLAIDPDTLATSPVGWFVKIGSLYLDKSRENNRIVTRCFTVDADGLTPLKDKRAAQAVLTDLAIAYARRTGALPLHTTAAGVVLTYAPNRFDTFPLKLGKSVGPDPKAFVAGLRAAPRQAPTKADEDKAPWRVEVSPSARATCSTCREKILKGDVRLGSPYTYEDHPSWRWHHLACGAARLTTAEKLLGFADLDTSTTNAVRAAIAQGGATAVPATVAAISTPAQTAGSNVAAKAKTTKPAAKKPAAKKTATKKAATKKAATKKAATKNTTTKKTATKKTTAKTTATKTATKKTATKKTAAKKTATKSTA